MSGNGLATGAGGALGELAGVALAPETGGLSLAIPAALGAAGAVGGDMLTGGGTNPLLAAVMGGIGGGLGGATSAGSSLVGSNALGLGDAAGASGFGSGLDASGNLLADAGGNSIPGASAYGSNALGTSSLDTSGLSNMGSDLPGGAIGNAGTGASGVASSAPSAGGLSSWIGTPKNALQTAMLGNMGLSAAQALMPKPQVNVGQNAANVMATNPSFNGALPKYTMQNTATPYTGNWYTYGQTPQTPMYNAQPVLQQAQGGLISRPFLKANRGYAHGGTVHGYAMGGQPMMPQGMPPQGAPPPMPPQQAASPQQVNPLALMKAHQLGVAIGQHLKSHGYDPNKTATGSVHGAGKGQDDAIPAKLSDGEYIMPSDVVSHLGDGSSGAGGKALDHAVDQIRKQKAVKGFPPRAKNPLSYMKGN